MRLNKLQQTAVTALEDIKARDIRVLDVRKLTSFYDSLIIASADSNRQVKALAHHVRDKLKEAGATIIGVEGEETGEWVLVDCGDIVVHVMQPAVRAYYNLEELWEAPAAARPRRGKRRRCVSRRPLQGIALKRAVRRQSFRSRHQRRPPREAADRRARSPDARLGERRLRRIRPPDAARTRRSSSWN